MGGQSSVRIAPPCLLITVVPQPGTSSPPFRLKRYSEGVIWMCRASFTLMMTGVFSRNVSKLFSELKLHSNR